MDIATAVLLALVILVVLVVSLVALSTWRHTALEKTAIERMRLEYNLAKVRPADEKNPKKNGKRRKDDEEEGEADDLDVLIEAARPFKALVGGFLQGRNVPVDVDALFEHDEGEKAKVAAWVQQASRRGGGASPPDWLLGDGRGDGFVVGR